MLLGYTHNHQIFPEVGGFRAALFVSAALGVATAVISFVLPGKGATAEAVSGQERIELAVVGVEDEEPAGTGLTASPSILHGEVVAE